jgi:mannitol/fructose-specific phosphotransferase system IIA component (Ntr-type)
MRIRDAVRPERVFLDLDAETGREALAAFARSLSEAAGVEAELIETALREREELGSTAVGNGFAIPHCKLVGLDEIVVGLARLHRGIDFGDSRTGNPVRFFFVVLSPPDQPTEHLQVLSQIARILKGHEPREQLVNAASVDAVVDAIDAAVAQVGL